MPRADVGVLARSLARQLQRGGYTRGEIVTFATELLSCLTDDIRSGAGRTGAT